ncbi:MAG: hypothetical protein ACUVV0_02320 [Anaerolineae bacterium]
MSKTENIAIPEVFQKDISRAVRILKEERCSEIFIFGSGEQEISEMGRTLI